MPIIINGLGLKISSGYSPFCEHFMDRLWSVNTRFTYQKVRDSSWRLSQVTKLRSYLYQVRIRTYGSHVIEHWPNHKLFYLIYIYTCTHASQLFEWLEYIFSFMSFCLQNLRTRSGYSANCQDSPLLSSSTSPTPTTSSVHTSLQEEESMYRMHLMSAATQQLHCPM